MAIFHSHVAVVKRSAGHSSVAAAAYSAGERIVDERTGDIYDYSKRGGVVHSEIFAPKNAPEWVYDRSKLWNEVERVEVRKDAQLCRKWDIALPSELTPKQRLELTRTYCREELASRGMVVDSSIHIPHKKKSSNNHHFHLEATMREIGPDGFGRKNRDWNQPELIGELRKRWAYHANCALKNAGYEARIDHRSLEAQKGAALETANFFEEFGELDLAAEERLKATELDRPATVHLGKATAVLENRGIQSERGDYNRQVKAQVIALAAVRVERSRLKIHLSEINRDIETVEIQIQVIDLQKRRVVTSKAKVDQIVPSEPMSCQASGLSGTLPPRSLESKVPPQQPVSERFNVSDKLAEKINELEGQWSRLHDQKLHIEKAIPDGDTIKSYRISAINLLRPQKTMCESLETDLRHQQDKWEVANFYWRDRGDREDWKLGNIKPNFLKSGNRLAWEAKGEELAQIKERLTKQVYINKQHLQDALNYLDSPQGQHAVENTRDHLINADYPHWRDAKEHKEQITQQMKMLRSEKCKLEKLQNDLGKYYPTLRIAMSPAEDIRERIRQPSILHLIKLIEQAKAKELTRKRQKELAIGRR